MGLVDCYDQPRFFMDEKRTIILDRERELKLNIEATENIIKKYGSLEEAVDKITPSKKDPMNGLGDVIFVLCELLNGKIAEINGDIARGIVSGTPEKPFDAAYVKSKVTFANIASYQSAIEETILSDLGVKRDKKVNDEERDLVLEEMNAEKNVETGAE